MSEVKRIFNEQYKECKINQHPQYKLETINSPVIYSVDCIFEKYPGKDGRRCDEFVFFNLDQNKTGIYLIERKDNESKNVNKVKEQLQGGAGFIEDFLDNDPATDEQPFDFMPVWISKGVSRSVGHELKKTKISLRNIYKAIKHIKAKNPLPKLT